MLVVVLLLSCARSSSNLGFGGVFIFRSSSLDLGVRVDRLRMFERVVFGLLGGLVVDLLSLVGRFPRVSLFFGFFIFSCRSSLGGFFFVVFGVVVCTGALVVVLFVALIGGVPVCMLLSLGVRASSFAFGVLF